jgi:hypothetical protein
MMEIIGVVVTFLFGLWVLAAGLFAMFYGQKITGNKAETYCGAFLTLCGGGMVVGVLSMLEVSVK